MNTRQLVLGTAGHIDHGKTELIRALTGVDTDRLPDEKRRGISIDLGFTRLDSRPDVQLSVVDVPGHEGFIRNMVAGATGMDLVLLVVAADEGFMPQTREHLAVIELLGVGAGVVAITKTDLVDPEWLGLVVEEAREELAGTTLAEAPIVPVSSTTGVGVDDVRAAVTAATGHAKSRSSEDLFRLPIDRVFTVRGTGTVVTGTVWSGKLAEAETGRVLAAGSADPSGVAARVRALQVHGTEVDAVHAGERAAVALVGVDRDSLSRGDTLVRDGVWQMASMITARLRILGGARRSIRHRQRVRLHLGTAEVMARVVPLTGREIAPGDFGLVQLRLETPIVARAGDPFVIRSYSPVTTIGGGRVVEPVARKRKRITSGTRSLLDTIIGGSAMEAVHARARLDDLAGTLRSRLPVDTPYAPAAVDAAVRRTIYTQAVHVIEAGERVFADDVVKSAAARLLERIRAYHERQPLEPGIEREVLLSELPAYAAQEAGACALTVLRDAGAVRRAAGRIAESGFAVRLDGAQERARARLLAYVREAGLEAPSVEEFPDELRNRSDLPQLMRLLVREGGLVRLPEDRYMDPARLADAVHRIRAAFTSEDAVKPADFKRVLPVSRKYLMPILAHLDHARITIRGENGRYLREDSTLA